MDYFQIGHRVACDAAQPSAPSTGIGNPVGVAQIVWTCTPPVFRLHPMQQHHADLRAESRSEVHSIFDWIEATFRQVQRSQLRVYFLEVRDRRYTASFQ